MKTDISYESTLDSQYTFKYCYLDTDSNITANSNDFNLIIFIISGKVLIKDTTSKSEEVFENNSMILLSIGNLHHIKILKTAEILFYSFNYSNLVDMSININMFSDTIQPQDKLIPSLKFGPIVDSFLILICNLKKNDIDCFKNNELYKLKQQEFFILINILYKKTELSNFFSPILNQSLGFKEKVLLYHKDARTVTELAEMCGYGQRDFTRKFVRHFRILPYKWMLNHMAKRVVKLLETNKTFKEIMYECRFSSPAHLTKFCKNYIGQTPSDIRKNMQNKIELK